MTQESHEPEAPRDGVDVECHLPAPVAKVWRALTTPALLAAWLMPNDLAVASGEKFRLFAQNVNEPDVEAEILEREPMRRLVLSWREVEREADERSPARATPSRAPATVVTFILTPAVSGTYLRIIQRRAEARPTRALAHVRGSHRFLTCEPYALCRAA